jgi:hypothetical protein
LWVAWINLELAFFLRIEIQGKSSQPAINLTDCKRQNETTAYTHTSSFHFKRGQTLSTQPAIYLNDCKRQNKTNSIHTNLFLLLQKRTDFPPFIGQTCFLCGVPTDNIGVIPSGNQQ